VNDLRVATVQFEGRDNDKAWNLQRMGQLTRTAVERGAQIVSFHEICIPGYTWLQSLDLAQMQQVGEPVPDGPSVRALTKIAAEYKTVVMAGLVERDEQGRVYNCYVTVGPEGYLTKYRKLHTFINPHLTPGDRYNVIDLLGWKVGFLICYDNNLVENVRMTAMLGAQVIIAPHVTACLPSPLPGRGTVDRQLWDNRHRDPQRLRLEFQGPKGRAWLMKWLPTRAYENGVYYVFSNPVGWDYDTVKPGLAMIIDPYGDVIAESHALEDDVVVALLTPEKLLNTPGERYRKARRPELYGKLVEPQKSETLPGWTMEHQKDHD
jgi:predicted amidohydrolase